MSEAVPRPAAAVAGYTGVVWVSGSDTVSFLDGLLSQNIAAIPVGGVQRALLLAPNGKLRSPLWVLRGSEAIGLATDAGVVEVVAGDLARFRIRVDVAIAVEARPVWEIWGSDSGAVVPQAVGPGGWVDQPVVVGQLAFRHSPLGRYLVIGDVGEVPVASPQQVAAWRLEVGEPVMGVDLDDHTIPQEAFDLTDAVDFSKGCYLGQELVARIDTRGHVNRRLAALVLPELPGTLPAEIRTGDQVVGTVTSAAWSVATGAAIGLGMVRRIVPDTAAVVVAGIRGRLAPIPVLP
jgi:folate-binding protein YgfZ